MKEKTSEDDSKSINILIRYKGDFTHLCSSIKAEIQSLDHEFGFGSIKVSEVKNLLEHPQILAVESNKLVLPTSLPKDFNVMNTLENNTIIGMVLAPVHLHEIEYLNEKEGPMVLIEILSNKNSNEKTGTVDVICAVQRLYEKAKKLRMAIKYYIAFHSAENVESEDSIFKTILNQIHNNPTLLPSVRQNQPEPVQPLTAEQLGLFSFCRNLFPGPGFITFNYYIAYQSFFLKQNISVDTLCRSVVESFNTYYTVMPEERQNFLNHLRRFIRFFWISYLYSPYSIQSLEAANIIQFHTNPYLSLTGSGVIVGVVDTGIDYLHPAFQYEDGTTKIIRIWDQTIKGNPPNGGFYGTEYIEQQINEAIQASRTGTDPYTIVPSRDENGHGTFLAGVAAGRQVQTNQGLFIGAAPDAELVIVKLKEASSYLRDWFGVQDVKVPLFQSSDVLAGIEYLYNLSLSLNRPLVVLIGLGTNQGSHDLQGRIQPSLMEIAKTAGVIMVCCAGNEGNTQKHARGILQRTGEKATIELKVAQGEKSFVLNIWCQLADKFSIAITSPGGETTGLIRARRSEVEELQFLLEASSIMVIFEFPEFQTGVEQILVYFQNPTQGIWTIELYGDNIVDGIFDLWLPRSDWILPDTVFLEAEANVTITEPATSDAFIAVGAYDIANNSLWSGSSRGYSRTGQIKPDIVAPGVNILGPVPGGGFATRTGTSVAAAVTAGASALMAEWGIKYGLSVPINTEQAKGMFALGARRDPQLRYPNPNWGYGILDLERIFRLLG